MANEEDTGKTAAESEDHVWALADKIRFALYTAWDGDGIVQWPLTAHVSKDAGTISFLVGDSGAQYQHLAQHPGVTLGFADHPKYTVIHGKAELSNDRSRIRALFSVFAKAWWDSAEDPSIRLITFTPDRAEYWDSGSSMLATVVMLTAAVTGSKPAVGEHAKVAM